MTTDPIAGLAPEARVRLEVFWEIVKRMNLVSAAEWDAARQQALLTESMILDGAASRTPAGPIKRAAWAPVAPEIAAVVERMARAGAATSAIRRETGLPGSTVRGMIARKGWKTPGQAVASAKARGSVSLPNLTESPPPLVEAAKPAPATEPEPSPPASEPPRAATINPFSPKPDNAGRYQPKLSAEDLVVIRRRAEAGESYTKIAADYGVSDAAICARARNGGWSVPVRRRGPALKPTVSRETPPPAALSGNGIATKNKIRAAALAAGIGVDRAPTMQTVDAAALLRGRGHRVTRLPLEGTWRVDDHEPMTLPELERLARQVAP